jgi:hypothetical protein
VIGFQVGRASQRVIVFFFPSGDCGGRSSSHGLQLITKTTNINNGINTAELRTEPSEVK